MGENDDGVVLWSAVSVILWYGLCIVLSDIPSMKVSLRGGERGTGCNSALREKDSDVKAAIMRTKRNATPTYSSSRIRTILICEKKIYLFSLYAEVVMQNCYKTKIYMK